jgi:proline dehydrogenase
VLVLRGLLLYLAGRRWLRRWIETSRWPSPLTRRFVAGATLEEGLAVCRRLNAGGTLVSLDHLGEQVASAVEARASTAAYIEAVENIARLGLQASVSIKLTQLGLDVSLETCETGVARLVARAAALGGFVEIDMESSRYVESTLRIAREMHRRFGCVRAVIQAYLDRKSVV